MLNIVFKLVDLFWTYQTQPTCRKRFEPTTRFENSALFLKLNFFQKASLKTKENLSLVFLCSQQSIKKMFCLFFFLLPLSLVSFQNKSFLWLFILTALFSSSQTLSIDCRRVSTRKLLSLLGRYTWRMTEYGWWHCKWLHCILSLWPLTHAARNIFK